MSFKGFVRIDGKFTGEIVSEGIERWGISGDPLDIHVSNIIISGEIRGNIIADKRIQTMPRVRSSEISGPGCDYRGRSYL